MPDTATVTILFTDVVGSVELRASRGDESAHKVMETHFELVRREIERHSGQEVKTMGDGFMVAFTSARRALDCAVALQQALADHNRNNPEEQVQARIGLNTGEAIEKDGDLFGTAVDAAARIMSKAAGGQILVSESVRSVIGSAQNIALIDRGPFWLKGFPERWRLYEVLWQEEKPSSVPAPPRMAERTPYVGRENERADLRRFLERAKSGHGSLVMIGGEPGVGKTRIMEELVAEARRHGFLTLTGHCYEMEGAPPYIPFIEILQEIIRTVEPSALLDTLGNAAPEAAKLAPELREIFPDIPQPRRLAPEQERFYLFNNLRDFFERLAGGRPLLMVIEDLHWTDEPTLLLLQHIAQRVNKMPVLMVGTYRTTELDIARSLARVLEDLLRQRLSHELTLQRLSQTEVSAMLQGRSGHAPPLRLVETIYKETEGNPFFVEEVFKHLAEEGKLFDAAGQWHADLRVEETDVPRGVLLVIGRRLERVSEECRRILARAAVIGRGIGFNLLNAVIELSEDELFDAIEEAERAQLIRSKKPNGEIQLTFVHELIRQTLLNELSLPRRQRLHLRVAEAMERLYPRTLEHHAADLAYHFNQAGGDPEKIISYSMMAAERATAQTAYEDAVSQYERALRVFEQQQPIDEARHCNLLLALGNAHENAGDPPCAKEAFYRVIDIARKLPAPEHFAEAVLGLCLFSHATHLDYPELIALMDEALALLSDGDSALRAALLGRLASLTDTMRAEQSFAISKQALAMARRVGDPTALFYALWAGVYDHWTRPLEERISFATALADLEEEMVAPHPGLGLQLLCHVHLVEGDIAKVESALDALKRKAEETSHPSPIWVVKIIETALAGMRGQFEDAERLAFEGFALGRKVDEINAGQHVGATMYLVRYLRGGLEEVDEAFRSAAEGQFAHAMMYRAMLANLHVKLGREREGREELERLATNDFSDLKKDASMLSTFRALSEVAVALGDYRRAAQIYDLLLPYADYLMVGGLFTTCLGSVSHWLALLAGTMKRWDYAVGHFEKAIETNTRIGARPWLAISQHEYARMLIERNESGDKVKAKTLLTEATATYRELDMPTFLEDAEELMKSL